jgi:hypothetical protein
VVPALGSLDSAAVTGDPLNITTMSPAAMMNKINFDVSFMVRILNHDGLALKYMVHDNSDSEMHARLMKTD